MGPPYKGRIPGFRRMRPIRLQYPTFQESSLLRIVRMNAPHPRTRPVGSVGFPRLNSAREAPYWGELNRCDQPSRTPHRSAYMNRAPRFLAFGPVACSNADISSGTGSSPRHASSHRALNPL
jgi:hypothetical protein